MRDVDARYEANQRPHTTVLLSQKYTCLLYLIITVSETGLQKTDAVSSLDASLRKLHVEVLFVGVEVCPWWILERRNFDFRSLKR